ncbi:MAG: OmpH family outer membrane protein [Terriglobia bacterium]
MRSKFIAVSALAFTVSLSAWAQSQKIAVIDMQGAILQTKEGQKASGELKAKFGPREDDFNKRGQALTAKQDQYRKAAATMSDDAKAAADRDIALASRNLQHDVDDAKADFQTEENKLLGAIMSRMQAVLNKYANDNQITMIVDISSQPNNLLFADQSANITTAIISLYDKTENTPALTGPAPAAKAPAPQAPVRKPGTPAAPAPRPK